MQQFESVTRGAFKRRAHPASSENRFARGTVGFAVTSRWDDRLFQIDESKRTLQNYLNITSRFLKSKELEIKKCVKTEIPSNQSKWWTGFC